MSMDVNMPEVKVSCCVVKPKGRSTIVRVTNNSSCPITMAQGTTVAICHRVPEHYVMEVNEVQKGGSQEESNTSDSQLQFPEMALNLDNADLDSDQKAELNKCLKDNINVFAVNMKELGKTDLYYHRIDTGNARPVA